MIFQDKDISSLIMTPIQRISINKRMRKDALPDFLKEKILNHKITDQEVAHYCQDCLQIGFVFSGILRYGMRGRNVVISCLFNKVNDKLEHGPVMKSKDWRHDKVFCESYQTSIDFSDATPSNILRALHLWKDDTDGWSDPEYYYTLEGRNTNYRITYDVLTIYNILHALYKRYDYPLEPLIENRIKKRLVAIGA